jgi:hypothetical protein
VAVERNGFNAMNSSERVGSNILSAVERTAGETRLSNAVSDATNRQSTNDLARDIINQGNRDASNIQKSITDNQYSNLLSDASNRQTSNDIARDVISRINDTSTNVALAVEKTGSAMQILQHANGYETRTLVNDRSNNLAQELFKTAEKLSTQGYMNYTSLLLEQQRAKECLAKELSDAKYEALKNKEALASQLAIGFTDNKYEALKNSNAITSQLSECCCEIKTKLADVKSELDDTMRNLDTSRLRDNLNTANNEINLLKVIEHTRSRSR